MRMGETVITQGDAHTRSATLSLTIPFSGHLNLIPELISTRVIIKSVSIGDIQ